MLIKYLRFFGRSDFKKYIQNQIEKGNLVRIKNRSNTSSERNALIAEGYRNIASNNIILQDNNTVNNDSMQRNEKNIIGVNDVGYFEFLRKNGVRKSSESSSRGSNNSNSKSLPNDITTSNTNVTQF